MSGLELEVSAAVARVRENGGALIELRHLLTAYSVLKRGPAEGEEHSLKPGRVPWSGVKPEACDLIAVG